MDTKKTTIRWGSIFLWSILAFILTFILVMIVIMVYATVLRFQARGAPDQAQIAQFATVFGMWGGLIITLLLTFLASILVARKAKSAAQINGLIVGIIVVVLSLIWDIMFPESFGLTTIIFTILTVAAGWLGFVVISKKKVQQGTLSVN